MKIIILILIIAGLLLCSQVIGSSAPSGAPNLKLEERRKRIQCANLLKKIYQMKPAEIKRNLTTDQLIKEIEEESFTLEKIIDVDTNPESKKTQQYKDDYFSAFSDELISVMPEDFQNYFYYRKLLIANNKSNQDLMDQSSRKGITKKCTYSPSTNYKEIILSLFNCCTERAKGRNAFNDCVRVSEYCESETENLIQECESILLSDELSTIPKTAK